MAKIVWRYENANGEGPYIAGALGHAPILFSKFKSVRHPLPPIQWLSYLESYTDPQDRKFSWLCCWVSYSQVRRWFTPMERRMLVQNGFALRRYKVPNRHVLSDKRQGIFKKQYAKVVK